MTVTAHLDTPSVSVEPGGEQHVTVRIRNNGDIVESYRLDVVGATSAWAVVEPATLSLLPGRTEDAVLTFRPPRSPDLPAEEMPYAVRVLPSERPDGAVVPEGTVRVLPFHELDAQLLPRTTSGRLRARTQVGVKNLGNTSAQIRLAATDSAERLQQTLKPGTLTIRPGELVYADLTVRSRRRLWRGKAKPHPFQVEVTPATDPDPATTTAPAAKPAVLPGTYEQLPLLPGWVFGLAAMALALVTLWFTMVRPAVRSAARESVDAQVKQAVQAAVNPAAASAPGTPRSPGAGGSPAAGGGGAGAGASPGAGGGPGAGGAQSAPPAGPGAAGGPAQGPGQGFSTWLTTKADPGGHGEASYKVPDGRLLLLTDLTAYAPQGDEGTLTVSINGTEVATLALENFRDRNFPWLTPIQAPPKSKIVLSVDCRKPGTPPDASATTACAESVFVSGSSVTAPTPTPSDSGH
ncbi:hydrolytic protein [Kitasatospora sp. MAP5-34]|uniref:COG1470 family protein n=1 Tax=Kitasatospora sp. MAP5-34 TaxID=3035102 RepID=UPI0024763CB2|nr:hydrolytic protein [Kitasatospora sp. MAP5-34]